MKNNIEINNNNNDNNILLESIKWTIKIRWGILGILTLLLLFMQKEMNSVLLLCFIAASLVTSLSSFVLPMLKTKKRNLEVFFFTQILMDILVFSVSIYFNKNFQNSFSLIYLIPIISTSIVISTNAGLALASISSLTYIYVLNLTSSGFLSLELTETLTKVFFYHLSAFFAGFLSCTAIKQKLDFLVNKNKEYKDELKEAQKHIIESKKELRTTYDKLNDHIQEMEMTNTQVTKLYDEMEKTNLQLSNKVKALSILHEVGNAINSVHDLNKLLNFIIICATEELHADSGSIMILNKTKNELEIKIAKGLDKETINKSRVKIGESISGWVVQNGEPVLINNIDEDNKFKSINRSNKYQTKSCLSVPLRIKDKIIGVINLSNKKNNENFSQDDLEFLITLANHAAISIENAQLYRNIRKSYFDTISALAMTIEAKDPHTRGHSKRVTDYAVLIAKKIELTPPRIEIIRYAAILHDIGKIGISEKIISKKCSLSPDEFTLIRNHPLIGESIIEPIDFLQSVKPIIRYHHERYDGTGYPDGIIGDEIPLEARILTLADSYDAMTSDRPYRTRLSHQDALREVIRNSGSQFDPHLKDKFLEIF